MNTTAASTERTKAAGVNESERASPAHGDRALRFLLAGNSAYLNRGCEAILRGTCAILRRSFGPRVSFVSAEFSWKGQAQEADTESDPAVRHVPISYPRYSKAWWLHQCDRRLGLHTEGKYYFVRREVAGMQASLQVGGDNYSLDYGRPHGHFDLDDYLLGKGLPVFIWGASVGPFDADPEFAPVAKAHLNKLTGIFVRETRSYDYLRRWGLTAPIHLVADPAFALRPEAPAGEVPLLSGPGPGPIGLNFSSLMARYVTGGNVEAWTDWCVEAVIRIMRARGENILLVPHVFGAPHDDEVFLTEVAARVQRKTGTAIPVTGHELSAAQLKWVISRCSVFVGARTHSTIAAFSSQVPTLSLAYSVKAKGLNQDILGTLDYCIDPRDMTPETIAGRTCRLAEQAPEVRERLAATIPAIESRAFSAGDILAEALDARERGRTP